MQWGNPCFQQHQFDRAAVDKCGKSCRGTTLTQPCLGLGLCSSCAKSSSKERVDWVAGSRNTSHPLRLWKAVKPAGRTELISSIKTWLYLFQLPLQYIRHSHSPRAAASLTRMPTGKQGSWKRLEEVGRTAAVDPFTVSALTLEGHILPGAGHRAAAPTWSTAWPAAPPAHCRNSKPHLAASAMHSSDTEVTGQRSWAHFHP